MTLFTSKKRLIAEREQLQLKLDERLKSPEHRSLPPDQGVQALMPYVSKIQAVDTRIMRFSSKRSIQKQLDKLLDTTAKSYTYIVGAGPFAKEEANLKRSELNSEIRKLEMFLQYDRSNFITNYLTQTFAGFIVFLLSIAFVALILTIANKSYSS